MIEEFKRWMEAGRCNVWHKTIGINEKWDKVFRPVWNPKSIYIVDDEHATLRMLQVDSPETKFEVELSDGWTEVREPLWDLDNEYRVKVEELVLYIEYIDTSNNNIIVQPISMTITSDYYETGRTFELPTKDL